MLKGNEYELYTTAQVIETYGTNCHVCSGPIDMEAQRSPGKPGWERSLHIDHLVPISKGGPDNLENVRPSHGLCNIKKKDRILEDGATE
jgi:5-methylcytosine-specific restriction endonuclease McrA